MSAIPGLAGLAELTEIGALDRRYSPVLRSASRYGALLEEGGFVMRVRDTGICGFAAWRPVLEDAELLNLLVVPEARGQGLGAALLRASRDSWLARGAQRLLLELRAGNAVALRLYRRLGFVEDGRRRGYYPARGTRPAEDALLMSLTLQDLP